MFAAAQPPVAPVLHLAEEDRNLLQVRVGAIERQRYGIL
jgi:hypothetical protein